MNIRIMTGRGDFVGVTTRGNVEKQIKKGFVFIL